MEADKAVFMSIRTHSPLQALHSNITIALQIHTASYLDKDSHQNRRKKIQKSLFTNFTSLNLKILLIPLIKRKKICKKVSKNPNLETNSLKALLHSNSPRYQISLQLKIKLRPMLISRKRE